MRQKIERHQDDAERTIKHVRRVLKQLAQSVGAVLLMGLPRYRHVYTKGSNY